MANKRIYQLNDVVTITGKYVMVDKSGNSEAERWSVDNLVYSTLDTDVSANTEWQTGYKAKFGDSGQMQIYYSTDAYIDASLVKFTGGLTVASDVWVSGNVYADTPDSDDVSTKLATTEFVDQQIKAGVYNASAGSNSITFQNSFDAGTVSSDITIVPICVSSDWGLVGYDVTSKSNAGFDIYVDYACEVDYIAARRK